MVNAVPIISKHLNPLISINHCLGREILGHLQKEEFRGNERIVDDGDDFPECFR